jgi:hypothetical protein
MTQQRARKRVKSNEVVPSSEADIPTTRSLSTSSDASSSSLESPYLDSDEEEEEENELKEHDDDNWDDLDDSGLNFFFFCYPSLLSPVLPYIVDNLSTVNPLLRVGSFAGRWYLHHCHGVQRVIIGGAILEGVCTLLLSEQGVTTDAVRALSLSYWQQCLRIGVLAGVIISGNAGTGIHVVVLVPTKSLCAWVLGYGSARSAPNHSKANATPSKWTGGFSDEFYIFLFMVILGQIWISDPQPKYISLRREVEDIL